MADVKPINNIDLSKTDRQRFSINNDPDRVVWLNLSDVGIAARFQEYNPKFFEILEKIEKVSKETSDDEQGVDELISTLKQADIEMRELMDKLFDAEVSKACAPDGTMYDLFDGKFRFQIIIEALAQLYNDNLDTELNALKKKADKSTKKYHK